MQQLMDKSEIMDKLANFSLVMDHYKDPAVYPAKFKEIFADGDTFQLARTGNGSGGPGDFSIKLTSDQFISFIAGVHSKYVGTQHMSCNTTINFTAADAATSRTYCHNYHLKAEDKREAGDFFVFVGVYDDTWTKTADGWKISLRQQWPFYQDGVPSS